MTSSVSFPLIPGKAPVDFRFTIKTARELDKAAQHGIAVLLKNGQTTDALVLMTCYGLKHSDHRMNEGKAEELIQRYVDDGGDAAELLAALTKALQASGVFGKVEGDEANPTQTAPTTAEVTTA